MLCIFLEIYLSSLFVQTHTVCNETCSANFEPPYKTSSFLQNMENYTAYFKDYNEDLEGVPAEYNVYESREASRPPYEHYPHGVLQPPNKEPSQRDSLLEVIFSQYKAHERPTEVMEVPTIVTFNVKILAIFSVDVRTMDYYVDALCRQTWVDSRLAWHESRRFQNFTQPLVSPKLKEKLWLPDLFFRNGKDGYLHKMTVPNYLLRVYPNGSVLYSQKITMRFSCQMDLKSFPMDTQKCDINIGSYGYTSSELRFVWRESGAVELPDKLQISEFNTPSIFKTLDCSSSSNTSTGDYTCLLAKFTLKRQIGSYLVATYIPNILIIMVSWLTFWVNIDAAPARVPLGLMSLLCLLTQASSMTSSLPRVAYIKAIDLWFIFSIIFVICVLVEYAMAIYLLRKKRKAIWMDEVRAMVRDELSTWCTEMKNAIGSEEDMKGRLCYLRDLDSKLTLQIKVDAKRIKKAKHEADYSKIDSYSRVVFPTFYLIYNLFYWSYYLVIAVENEDSDT